MYVIIMYVIINIKNNRIFIFYVLIKLYIGFSIHKMKWTDEEKNLLLQFAQKFVDHKRI
jgi:hypothetical protein